MDNEIEVAHDAMLQLDKIDREIDALDAEAIASPANIDEEEALLAEFKTELVATQASLKAVQERQSEQERSLTGVERRKVRADNRLGSLGTMGQIEATQREIAALTIEAGEIETSILETMEEVEELEASIEKQETRFERGVVALAAHKSGWNSRRGVVESRLAELKTAREPLVAVLRPDVLRRYLLGRNQKQWPTITGITWALGDRVCRTCHGQIPARWVNEARSHLAYHACDGCKRMLVPDLAWEEVAKAAAALAEAQEAEQAEEAPA